MTPDQVQGLIKELDLNQHDVVVEAVLVARVHDLDTGATGIAISVTDGVTWVAQLGMLRAAEIVTTRDVSRHDGQD